jgi:hypothetical protein
MNYLEIYNKIIEKAKSRGLVKKVVGFYTEKHHIIPKCVGGSDSKDNLVLLTAQEHFIAHKLLVEIYPNESKLKYAIWSMCRKSFNQDRGYNISSREYNRVKFEMANTHSLRMTGNIQSRDHVRKRLKSLKATLSNLDKSGENNPMWGKTFLHSEESRSKMSESRKGKSNPWKSEPWKGVNNPFFGIKRTGSKNPNSKPIKMLSLNGELEKLYNYISAAKEDGFYPSNIIQAIRLDKTYRGKRWMYA